MKSQNLSRKLLGNKGESIASEYLQKHGYQIIERNFKARYGELDIVAIRNSTLVIVEVKTRTNTTYGKPEEAISKRKLHELVITTQYYAMLHPEFPHSLRIDLVAIALNEYTGKHVITHIEDISS